MIDPWILAAAGGVGAAGLALDRMALALLRPQRRPVGHSPEDIGFTAEPVEVSGDPALYGWWIEGRKSNGPVVILAHGWGANAGALLSLVPQVAEEASYLVAVDTRGHGRSDDAPVVSIRHFRDDLVRVIAYVRSRTPDRPIVLAGHSMGGASGILAAEASGDLAGLALIAAPHDVFGTVARYMRERGLPGHLMVPFFLPSWRLRIGESARSLDPGRALAALELPTLVLQPALDTRVPPSEGEALARSAGTEVSIIPGAGHSDVLEHPRAGELLRSFVAQVGAAPA